MCQRTPTHLVFCGTWRALEQKEGGCILGRRGHKQSHVLQSHTHPTTPTKGDISLIDTLQVWVFVEPALGFEVQGVGKDCGVEEDVPESHADRGLG